MTAALLGAFLWMGGAHRVMAGTDVWTPIGPGGTINDLAIDPQNPSTLYAAGNGVFKSINGGSRWFSIGADLGASTVSKIVIDPRTPSTLYAATGSNGVFKSADGGRTWQPANTGLTGALRVNALAIDPRTPRILYASLDHGGVYKSADGGGSWAPRNSGLFNYQLYCGIYCTNVVSLAIDPITPTVLYVGTESGSIFKSTDGGEYWSLMRIFPVQSGSISTLAIDPHNQGAVYANTSCGGLFKSLDAGGSWIPTGLTQAGCYTRLFLDSVSDPGTTTTLYALTYRGFHKTTLLKSTDGAATWSGSGDASVMMTTLAIDPRTPATLYAGLWQEGVLKSTDAGGNWSPANAGLLPLPLFNLAVDSANPATIYGLNLNRPFKSTDGGDTWRPAVTGLQSDFLSNLHMDPKTPSTLYLVGTSPTRLYKTTDGAETWRKIFEVSFHYDFVALIIDRQTPATLYAATSTYVDHYGSVYRSTDGGETWYGIWSGEGVTSVSLEGSNPSTLYLMDWRGRTYKSTDGGPWIVTAWPFHHPEVLATDPRTPAILYGWDHGLFKSTDGGVTWNATGATLPDLYVTSASLFIDPVTTSTLYFTSYGIGLFRSTDGGAAWAEFDDGLIGQSARNVRYLSFDPRTPSTIHAQTSAGIFIISAPTRVLDPTIDFSSPQGKGSGVVRWRTDQERDLQGFNIVTVDDSGLRTQINDALIACQACATGSAGDYTFIVPKHRSGRDLYIEQVYRDDHVERFELTRQK